MSDLEFTTRIEIDGYQVLRQLATGGTSRIFLAIQESLNRKVAIKLLYPPSEEQGQKATWKFSESASQLASIRHPNVVLIIDTGMVDGTPYIVQEFVEGGDLRELLEGTNGLIEKNAAFEFIKQIASGLTELHACGITHSDLKPENILVDGNRNLLINDIGILVSDGGEKRFLGTEGYAAPEQRYRIGLDARSDQYSFALLSVELLTGQLPNVSIIETGALIPKVGKKVNRVIERATHEDPELRYASVADFLGEFERAWYDTSEKPTASMPVPFVATLVVACAVICFVAIGLVGWQYYGSNEGTLNERDSGNDAASLVGSPAGRVEQTGALCFRVIDGQLEFLLVRNRTDTHWTIPKENQSASATIEETIEEEAFEEAGARGKAYLPSVGDYRYSRNGNDYSVSVYPIQIEQTQDEWPEDFRKRQWFLQQEAVNTIRSTGLREILRRFEPPES